MTTGPKPGRGGARKGAGRKKRTISQREVNSLRRTLARYKKQTGKSVDDVLCDMIYHGMSGVEADYLGKTMSVRDRLMAMRLVKEITTLKNKEVGEEKNTAPPSPFVLPDRRPDPAKVVPFTGAETS